MKFLIALSVLASTAAFANDPGGHHWWKVKCYEPASQGETGDLVYVLKKKGHYIKVVRPFEQPLRLNEQSGCLEYPEATSSSLEQPARLTLCPGEGQRINGLVPVEATYGQEEETVYCDRKINRWFDTDMSIPEL